ncbi:2-aminoadipate transaminase [compost metagenome]
MRVEESYAARRTLMLQLLQCNEWRGCRVENPGGGLFLWVTLPSGLSSEALLRAARIKGVTFVPGTFCYAPSTGIAYFKDMLLEESIRLNFAAQSEDQISLGIALIGEAISEFTARS